MKPELLTMKHHGLYTAIFSLCVLFTGCHYTQKEQQIHLSDEEQQMKAIDSNKLPTGTVVVSHQNPSVRYTVVDYAHLPGWGSQQFELSLQAFKKGCSAISQEPKWRAVCHVAEKIENNRSNAKQFFEENFQVWRLSNEHGGLDGKVTGYYEPAISGSKTRTRLAQYPIYGMPRDLISVPIPAELINSQEPIHLRKTLKGATVDPTGTYFANPTKFSLSNKNKILRGRFLGKELIPYYSRKEIDQGAIRNQAPILAYANDPVDLFFLHVQGSGRVITGERQMLRLAYAEKNGLPYQSIGAYLVKQGYLPLHQVSKQSIQQYIAQHPEKREEILHVNPSFIFFKLADNQSSDGGPKGTLGVTLSKEYSGAVDTRYIELGTPLYLATTDPRNNKALNRLLMAQDTGSAITGSVRVDLFWGYGDEAGELAGKMNHTGYVWVLLPNGQPPH
ncbi:MAG: MltA domain-containing protein [Neisseriaceae bacterium]